MRAKIEEKLSKFVVSPTSREWIVKALDPACDGSAPGLPDANACRVARPDYRAQTTVGCPPAANDAWDMIAIAIPGDNNVLVWAAAPRVSGNVDFTQPLAPADSTCGAIQLQTTFDSYTCPYYAVTGAAGTIGLGSRAGFRMNSNGTATFRHQFKSITAEMTAPSLGDQGEVYCAQYPCEAFSSSGAITNAMIVGGAEVFAIGKSFAIPLDETNLMLSTPDSYVGRAKDGLYTVSRLNGPSQPFADVGWHPGSPFAAPLFNTGTFFNEVGNEVGSYQPTQFPKFYPKVTTGLAQVCSWVNAGIVTPTIVNSQRFDTGYDNTSITVMIWRGLSGTSVAPSSITFKVIVGLETCPRPDSPFRTYIKEPAAYDPRAIEAYYAISLSLASAYPARFNSLGALLPLIGMAATRLWPYALNAARSLATHFVESTAPPTLRPKPKVRAPSVARSVKSVEAKRTKPRKGR